MAANLRNLRDRRRGLSVYELARLLEEEGAPIPPSGISRIERSERRVDVDELAALAVVLGVNPSSLLLPRDAERGQLIEVTRKSRQPAWVVWRWADGLLPLPKETLDADADTVSTSWEDRTEFTAAARPLVSRDLEGDPARMAALDLAIAVESLLVTEPEPSKRFWALERIRRGLERTTFEVEQLLARPEYEEVARLDRPEYEDRGRPDGPS